MTTDNKQMAKRLWVAQAGDQQARDEVILYVLNQYRTRVARYYLNYPAFSQEDIEQEFAAGICEAIDKADHRGDPIYFIGQRGIWRVQSMVRAARYSEHGALEGGVVHESLEGSLTAHEVPTNDDNFGRVLARVDSERQVAELIVGLELQPQLQQITRLILSEELGGDEPGFNKRLAKRLGLSPQRVSQILAAIREESVNTQQRLAR